MLQDQSNTITYLKRKFNWCSRVDLECYKTGFSITEKENNWLKIHESTFQVGSDNNPDWEIV